MDYRRAQLAGAVMAAVVVSGGVLASRAIPKPCTGATSVQFGPPLLGPATYHFDFELGSRGHCEFSVELNTRAKVLQHQCDTKFQLQLRGPPGEPAIVGVLLSESPTELGVRIRRLDETIYETVVTPLYAVEAMRDGPDAFCGQSTLVKPECLRGSSQCKPFPVLCEGPEDCAEAGACCAAPGWGEQYGAERSMECTGRRACSSRIDSYVVCHQDTDCPKGMTCTDASLKDDFEKPLTVCEPAR